MANTYSYYKKKCDRLFQDWFTSQNPVCEICGKATTVGHHFITKGASFSLRYEPNNMIPCCTGCHLGFHSSRSSQFIAKTIMKRGNDWYKDLERKKSVIQKESVGYYKSIIKEYENLLAR